MAMRAAMVGLVTAVVLAVSSAWAADVMVHLFHTKVDRPEVTISAGEAVIFHNMAAMPDGYTLVADDGSFTSPPLAKDAQYRRVFEEPGTYSYHMKEHPQVKGTVVVK